MSKFQMKKCILMIRRGKRKIKLRIQNVKKLKKNNGVMVRIRKQKEYGNKEMQKMKEEKEKNMMKKSNKLKINNTTE